VNEHCHCRGTTASKCRGISDTLLGGYLAATKSRDILH